MAKDITKIIPDFKKKLDQFEQELTSQKSLTTIGNKLVERIVTRARLGFGVEDTGLPRKRFDPLSPNYKKWRRKNQKVLDGTTTPTKSNLTKTGEMLKAIYARVRKGRIVITGRTKKSRNKITWNASGTRTPNRIFLRLSDKDLKVMKEYFYTLFRKTLLK